MGSPNSSLPGFRLAFYRTIIPSTTRFIDSYTSLPYSLRLSAVPRPPTEQLPRVAVLTAMGFPFFAPFLSRFFSELFRAREAIRV